MKVENKDPEYVEFEKWFDITDTFSGNPSLRFAMKEVMFVGWKARAKPYGQIVLTRHNPDGDEEVNEFYLNGTLVTTTNHDAHGWAGMGAVETALFKAIEILGGEFKVNE